MKIERNVLAAVVLAAALAGVSRAEDAGRYVSDSRGEVAGSLNKGVYSKPFWKRSGKGAFIGGYVDFDYTKSQGANGFFRQHRLIPFIYADIAEGIRFATEIELEYGGPQNNQKDGDVKVEFAVVDVELFGEKMAARGGILLTPLGKLNLVHDTPLQDVTERPLVSRFVIPTTLSESGYGVFGTLYPTGTHKLDYEVYLVNGFNGTKTDTVLTAPIGGGTVTSASVKTQGANITAPNGLRNARGSQRGDNNNNKALAGRVGYSPKLGYEVGLSGHRGAYDDKAENQLNITAVDAAAQFGPLELLGEAAEASLDRGTGINKAVTPGRLSGWYGQANWHFLQDVVRPGSTFTGVLRYEEYDTDISTRQRWTTYGLNFRPVEDAVFVVDYAVKQEAPKSRNNTLSLSFASYF